MIYTEDNIGYFMIAGVWWSSSRRAATGAAKETPEEVFDYVNMAHADPTRHTSKQESQNNSNNMFLNQY